MKRIAIVLQTRHDPHSSVLLTYQALADELTRRGHTVSIHTPTDFPGATNAGRWTPIAYPATVARWVRRHEHDLDLVIFHSYAGWLAAATNATRTLAVVVAFHGLEPLYHRELRIDAEASGGLSMRYRVLQEQLMPRFLKVACRHASLITCLNGAERDWLVRQGWAPASRVVPVGHGVRDEFFAPVRVDRPLRSILFVAQWLPMKGIDVLRTAFVDLARRHPDLTLVCAGTLLSVEEVRAAFPSDVQPRVTVLPRVDQPALASLYRNADAFVFPSHYDGFGLALVEAMAARLPIVTTNVGVAADALRDGQSALVVPLRDSAAIVRAIESLIADPQLRSRLGDDAHTAAQNYRESDRVRAWADALASIDRVHRRR